MGQGLKRQVSLNGRLSPSFQPELKNDPFSLKKLKGVHMKLLMILFLLLANSAFADCDISPLQREIEKQYKTTLPVTNEKGELGHAQAKNFVIADYLMKMKNENFLIANFDLEIKWLKGHRQTVKTLIVATINPSTCNIEEYKEEL
jgi:hypothetical protein